MFDGMRGWFRSSTKTAAIGVTVLLSGANMATQFAPVPYMNTAVGVLISITDMIENVKVNRDALRQLALRCQTMLFAVRDGHPKSPKAVEAPLKDCIEIMEAILADTQAWAKFSWFHAFVAQREMAETIKKHHMAIQTTVDSFQVFSHVKSQQWQQDFQANAEKSQDETMSVLTDLSGQQDLKQAALAATQADVRSVMTIMQERLAIYGHSDDRYTHLQTNLYGVMQQTGELLPKITLQAGEVRRIGNHPCGGTKAFDIWEGLYLGTEKCSIKVLRGVQTGPDVMRRFEREASIWRTMWEKEGGRDYILPFYGIVYNDGPYPYMVSPWMENGDVLSYVRKYPRVDRLMLIRRMAEGIALLHGQTPPIVHGDIRSANIVVNNKGMPLLADFGLSKIMEDVTGVQFTQSQGFEDSYRWFAPELCFEPNVFSTKSDVFSFSMTVLEILTSQQPFASVKRTPDVLVRLQKGERPQRPAGQDIIDNGLDDAMWALICECWDADQDSRPTIQQVLERLPPTLK